ncbi:protein Loquacious-like [Centruroides vittatus]|uniref:protein Loquacious-like n=1 Tax=Centruroides vittatus TaxID=120091 RepID=UPI00350FDEBE
MNSLTQKTPISLLQEQCARLGMTPDYKLMSVEGVVHAPVFMYRVQVGDESATATGQSKKKAKHAAAKAILEVLSMKGFFGELGLYSDGVPIDISSLGSEKESTQSSVNEDGIPGNPVGKLQELCMKHRWRPPYYETKKEEGLPHERTFEIACYVNEFTEIGCGKSKRLAKRQAAHNMLEKLKTMITDNADQPAEESKQNGISYPDVTELYNLKEKKTTTSLSSNYAQELSTFLKDLKLNTKETLISLQSTNLNGNSLDFVRMLEMISEEQDFPIKYTIVSDLSISGKFQCLAELSSHPVAVCFGTGISKDEAKQNAANNALHYLKIVTKK